MSQYITTLNALAEKSEESSIPNWHPCLESRDKNKDESAKNIDYFKCVYCFSELREWDDACCYECATTLDICERCGYVRDVLKVVKELINTIEDEMQEEAENMEWNAFLVECNLLE